MTSQITQFDSVKCENFPIFHSLSKSCYIMVLKNRGEFMYTTYMIFLIVLIFSFFTGNIVLIMQSKLKSKGLVLKNSMIVDDDII